jgi:arylsulfatase A
MRTCLTTFFLLLAIPFGLLDAAEKKAKRPNVLLIMIDDLGWMDLHCQGNSQLDTPNLDRLAKQGMRFTAAYAAAPVCSPTRAAIMTGLSPARLQLTNHITYSDFVPKNSKVLPAKSRMFLPLTHDTLAERLKRAGYSTGFFGKWHLAGVPKRGGKGQEKYYPEHQGFDINKGGCAHGGPPSFFDPYRIHNLPDRRKGEYLPDRLADEAIQFMRKNKQKPFFVALWNYTVHWPMQAPENLVKKYEKRKGPGVKDPRYAAMIEAMDRSIGRILESLRKEKLDDNTLVIFASDNGAFLGVADIRPLRLGKGFLYEGGIRVPLIVRWPGVVKPGTLCNTPVISTDFFPTILRAAKIPQAKNEPADGENLLPLLTQTGKLKRTAIHFHYPNFAWHSQNRLGSAIRTSRYKLIKNHDDGSTELYDLSKDIGETRNLTSKLPKVATDLKNRLERWLESSHAALPRKVTAAKPRP